MYAVDVNVYMGGALMSERVKIPCRWVCLVSVIICALMLVWEGIAGIFLRLIDLNCALDSIGVIGGADGPTAIYVSTVLPSGNYESGILLTILVLSVAGFCILGRKTKR